MEDSFHPNHHYAPARNWCNDPNGLLYHDGIYELYYQYNPNGITWADMHWGHARSEDLVHWKEEPVALAPDEDGTMFSGCGIRNERGLLGLPKDALVYYYTAAGGTTKESKGGTFTVRLAYSLDGGMTLKKTHAVVTEPLARENRDPKVFWHEKSSAYIMVLYLEDHDFGIFRSTDLRFFTLTQRISLDGGFECPDLFELPVRNDAAAGTKWVFWAADGSYYLGTFDGFAFRQTQKRRFAYADGMRSPAYAAQSWSGLPNGTVRQIAWLRGGNVGGVVTHCMTYPRDLFLMKVPGKFAGDPDEFRLGMELPKGIEEKFQPRGELRAAGEEVPLSDGTVKLNIQAENDFSLILTGRSSKTILSVDYQAGRGFLLYGIEKSRQIMDLRSAENLEILYDRGILELSAEQNLTVLVADFAEERGEIPEKVRLLSGEHIDVQVSLLPEKE